MRNIALLTDFGYTDSYAGVMKAVIKSINPDADIIDITHGIESQNILQAAWVLYESYSYFPQNTIFISVVDPGVGSERKNILVKTEKYYFLAPDNGLLTYIINNEKIEKVISIENSRLFLKNVSSTFHGRDIFAPIGAYLSFNKLELKEFGPDLEQIKIFKEIKPVKNDHFIKGQVVNIDKFGNIVTNIPSKFLENRSTAELFINKTDYSVNIHNCYATAPKNELILITGSSNTIEISCNCASAQEFVQTRIGQEIEIIL